MQTITDPTLKGYQTSPPSARLEILDKSRKAFGARISTDGEITFFCVARFGNAKSPVRRNIGTYPQKNAAHTTDPALGVYTLADAASMADQWRRKARTGFDPYIERDNARQELERQAAALHTQTFERLAEDFKNQKLSRERKGKETEKDLDLLLGAWGDKRVNEITDGDIIKVVTTRGKKWRGSNAHAHNLLILARRLFAWATDPERRGIYGLTVSPCVQISGKRLLGEKKARQHILNSDELFAFWRATDWLNKPSRPEQKPIYYGNAYRLLLLSGLRLNEAVHAKQTELDRRSNLWVIPADRMKGKSGKAVPHAVPLTADILEVLDSTPKPTTGPYLFSANGGGKPLTLGDKVKKRLDRKMLWVLRALARKRGDNAKLVELRSWQNHDLRRTCRTELENLGVRDSVAEAIMAHVREGTRKNYVVTSLLPQKREALEKWASRLKELTAPVPSNVVPFRQIGA